MRWALCLVPCALSLGVAITSGVAIAQNGVAAAQGAAYLPYRAAEPVLVALREELKPAPLRGAAEAAWSAWVSARDAEIRGRVAGGEADSVVHLMLFGTSFTKAPRATTKEVAALVSNPDEALRAFGPRLDDLAAAILAPGANERAAVAREVVAAAGIDVAAAGARTAVRRWLEQRALAIGQSGAEQLSNMVADPGGVRSIYRERGLSTDTALTVDFGVERTLEAVEDTGVFRPGSVRRVAIVGPGLDFIDKQNGYDFYPQQTIQPFAVIDSLHRADLAGEGLEVAAFDLSPRVLRHVEMARARAQKGEPYTIVLPRNLERAMAPEFEEYWERFGNWIGAAAKTPVAPPAAGKIAVRAVSVRPDIVLAVTARDLNVVLQRAAPGETFDLVVATNVLLYYDVFEQSLALANIASMLRPGGLLLTNTRLVELPGVPMTVVRYTDVIYTTLKGVGETGDRIYWYQRQ